MPKRLFKERPDSLVRLHVSEPAPLGLFGLAGGCIVLFMVDFEGTSGTLTLIPWLLYLPATLQLIAGIIDTFRHNIFGSTAFIGYAFFWYGLATADILQLIVPSHKHYNDEKLLPKPVSEHLGIIGILYLIFSVILTVLTLGINKILFLIVFSIDFAFLFLILHVFMDLTNVLVGVALVFVFLFSIYGFTAYFLLKLANGEILPLGKAFIQFNDWIIYDKSLNELRKNQNKRKEKKINENESVKITLINDSGLNNQTIQLSKQN